MLKPGDTIPEFSFFVVGEDGPAQILSSDYFADQTTVLIGLPGAFTPTCDQKHLPTFIRQFDELTAHGVDQVAVVSVNDHWVMQAWQRQIDPGHKLRFLSDGNAEFAQLTGLGEAMNEVGYGTRLKRFAMVIRNGVVDKLLIEDHRSQHEASNADAVLTALR